MEFHYKDSARVSIDEIKALSSNLSSYVEHLREIAEHDTYDEPECSIFLPYDNDLYEQIIRAKEEKISSKLKYVVVVGIGGSNLGTKAVYDALQGHLETLNPNQFPKLLFADTTDPESISHLSNLLTTETKDFSEVLINIISKSGETLETIVNAETILQHLKAKFGENIIHRIVITCGIDSPLWKSAKEQNITILGIPEQVSGRFSVMSAVGLFPLSAIGFDIDKLRMGAQDMRKTCLNEEVSENPALLSATILFKQAKDGRTINTNFIFNPRLESLGKWYRQLLAESIGKNGIGLTPTVLIGSTDLHSVAQLHLDGPKDKVVTFISAKTDSNESVPNERIFPNIRIEITGKKLSDIVSATLESTKEVYKKKKIPYTEVVLQNISESSLGAFLQFKMIEIMYLGKLFGVNAFDQPAVESYKTATIDRLKQE